MNQRKRRHLFWSLWWTVVAFIFLIRGENDIWIGLAIVNSTIWTATE